MHEFRRFIEGEMVRLKMKSQADLVRASGLSKQHVSDLLTDTRDNLGRMPAPETIAGLATAFHTTPERVTLIAARALGSIEVDAPVMVPTVEGVSDEELARVLAERLTGRIALLDIDAIDDPKAVPQLIEFHKELVQQSRADREAGNTGLAEAKEWLASALDAAFAASAARRRPNPTTARQGHAARP